MNIQIYRTLTCKDIAPAEKIEAIQAAAKHINKNGQSVSDWADLICLVCKAMSRFYPGIKINWVAALILKQISDEPTKTQLLEKMPCLTVP